MKFALCLHFLSHKIIFFQYLSLRAIARSSSTKSQSHQLVKMKIYIHNLSDYFDQKFTLEGVEASDKVWYVKLMIEERDGFLTSKQKLIFNGEFLKDDLRLIDYGVKDECTISLIQLIINPPAGETIKVFVRTPNDNQPIALIVSVNESVLKLKSRIEFETGMHQTKQRLWVNGIMLSDDSLLSDYEIFDSTIYIHERLSGGLGYSVDITVKATGELIEFKGIQKTTKIEKFKEKIIKMKGSNVIRQNLFLDGVLLNIDQRIKNYNIFNGSTLELREQSSTNINIFIKDLSSVINRPYDLVQSMHLVVNPSEQIEILKVRIIDNLQLQLTQFKLIHKGQELRNERRLSDYDISHNSVINTMSINIIRFSAPTMRLFVRTFDNEILVLDNLNVTNTIRTVKEKIAIIKGIRVDKQLLITNEEIKLIKEERQQPFLDYHSLTYYNLENEDIIYLRTRLDFQISVKIFDLDKVILLEVNQRNASDYIKHKIEELEHIPFDQQLLIENDKEVEHLGLRREDAILLLVLKMKLIVKNEGGDEIEIEVRSNDTVNDLKNKIRLGGLSICDHNNVIFCGIKLSENFTLSVYNIKTGSTMQIDICSCSQCSNAKRVKRIV